MDAKFDGDLTEEMFSTKENEYKLQLFELKGQIDSFQKINPNFYEDGCKTLELSKRLYSLYQKANYEDKAKVLKLIASNYTLTKENLYPIYRRPFDLLAKGSSRTNWLPLLADFRNWLFSLNQDETKPYDLNFLNCYIR